MLMFHVDVNMKRLGIHFKNYSSMIQSQLFHLRDSKFTHGALSDSKLCRMFSFTLKLLHCMKGNFQKSIITLMIIIFLTINFRKIIFYPLRESRIIIGQNYLVLIFFKLRKYFSYVYKCSVHCY